MLLVFCSFSFFSFASDTKSDAEVKQEVIKESIWAYPGNCPCPYNSASNGFRCGKRSAWSRAGGYAPICYEREVSDEMIARWRKEHQ